MYSITSGIRTHNRWENNEGGKTDRVYQKLGSIFDNTTKGGREISRGTPTVSPAQQAGSRDS